MARAFFHSTAELTIRVVEAVHANGTASESLVESFCDLSQTQVAEALGLAADLGFVVENGGTYQVGQALAAWFASPNENRKAAVLRVALESYDVFRRFRERYAATGNIDAAAQQTKAMFDLDKHREDVKETLISLATYSGAMVSKGGGNYEVCDGEISQQIQELAKGCNDFSSAELWVRSKLGLAADIVSEQEVILPLASAIIKACSNQPDDAVTNAGNAFESYLAELAVRMGVDLSGANGISQKITKFRTGDKLPKKIVEASKYIGQVRNAAGHGVDTDVNASWDIQQSTAINLVCVVLAMIQACHEIENGNGYLL